MTTAIADIQIRDLEVSFQVRRKEIVKALGPISLDLPANSFVSLVGPSGCGKSTLLRVVSGLIRSTAGTVHLDGVEVVKPNTRVNFVFQTASLLPWCSVIDNILLPATIKHARDPVIHARAEELLQMMHLTDFRNSYPHELSGGMQQRAAIARAILLDPSMLLMDEPFSALDEFTREYLNEELLNIWSQRQMSVIFVTHSIAEAVFLSQKVVIISPRPGQITDIIDIDLPYPRESNVRQSMEFYKYITRIRTSLFEGLRS